MCEDEVDAVAAELARAGGIAWYPGREDGPLKIIKKRYRDRARLAIAALDRHRTATRQEDPTENPQNAAAVSGSTPETVLSVGVTVLYRPPGDRRAYQCKVEKIDGDRAYLMPDIRTCTGWIDIRGLLPLDPGKISKP